MSGTDDSSMDGLIHEVRSLGQEVTLLRGDTAYLNAVIVPREEQTHRRNAYWRIAAVSLVVLVIALSLFGYLLNKVKSDGDQLRGLTYASCLKRNSDTLSLQNSDKRVLSVVIGLRNAEQNNHTPGIDQVRAERIVSYNILINYLMSQPKPPSSPNCIQFK